MKKAATDVCTRDPWTGLKRFTNARIALGRAGTSLPTRAHMNFQLAHARARDAVTIPLDFRKLESQLIRQGLRTIQLHSQAADRQTYLQRPDKGRLLDAASTETLKRVATQPPPSDIALVIADGLSAKAGEGHAAAFASLLVAELEKNGYRTSPVCLVAQGRVAVGDPIGEILSSVMTVVLIGERPGLSSPDSLGIYFTYGPKRGRTDADRNCISNIHARGLSYDIALEKLLFLVAEADRLKLSGVRLKDDTPAHSALNQQNKRKNFLLE